METLWAKVAPAHTWCFPDIFLDAIASLESSLDKSVFQPVKERERYLFQVFYRVSKSDLWSYMVNTDLLPVTPSFWILSCVVFYLGGNQQIEQIVLIS